LEVARPLLPEGGELEARRTLELLVERAHRRHPGDAVDAHPGPAVRDQIPRASLEHQAQWVDRALHGPRPLAVAHADPAAAPDGRGESGQMRHAVPGAEPAAGVEVEQPRGA